jgi:GNAT superfamily N-acetyltransferase
MVKRIQPDEVVAVRHLVLRPGRAREDAIFECDGWEGTVHLGAFDGMGQLVGVATLFSAGWDGGVEGLVGWQLRGMATMPEVRGMGYGAALVREAERVAREAGGGLLWCQARVVAVSFYERMGWEVVGEEFDVPTVGPHFRMRRMLSG